MKKIILFLILSCISILSFAQVLPITGTFSICVGATTILSDGTPGGTWSSSNTGIATIGTSSGVVTGVSAGVVTITYAVIGNFTVQSFTVNPLPASISASVASVCTGSTITLTDATPGGTWSSSTPAVATIGSVSGVVTGVAAGSTVITYMLPTGCFVTTVIFVNPSPGAITGPNNVCVGSTIILTGTGGGTWSSGSPSIATVGSSSGVVTGVTAGVTVISYILPTGCFAITTVTVNPLPAPIVGSTGVPGISVCVGSTTTLVNPVAGGTWSTGSTAIATIGSVSGVLTGVSAGVTTVTYMLPTGCYSTGVVTVNPSPGAITGPGTVCVGSTIVLTGTGGGTWSSGSTSIATIGSSSGIVTGVTAGIAVITYMLPGGCFVTTNVTVNPLPGPIIGSSGVPGITVCVGSSITLLNAVAGGTWSTGNTSIATVGSSSGVLTGVSAGVTTITYMLPTGCYTTGVVTVNPTPGAITGPGSVCVGSTIVLTGTGGGTWSSGSTSIATIGSSSGIVTGVSAGVTVITYMLPGGCFVTTNVTVNPIPGVISSSVGLHLCVGGTMVMTNSVTGGTWSSSTTAVATIGSSSGVLTGVSAGTTTITYMLPTGCYTTAIITVMPTPGAITGPGTVCVGSTIILTGTGGGTWSSGTTTIATIGSSSGVVTGVSAGVTVITYMLPTGCFVTTTITVNPIPAAITGSAVGSTLCVGSTVALTSATPGGTWSSGTPAIATVGSLSGIVTAVSPGVVTITYTLPTGCSVSITIVVVASPGPITGTLTVCVGGTTNLSCTPSGGTWSSGSVAIATVGSLTGVVTGMSPGTSVITYTLPSGCSVSVTVTVTIGAGPISGPSNVCVGSTINLTAPGSGVWSSSNTAIATVVPTSGVVTGVSAGTATITYMLSSGCIATTTITVNPLPGRITGPLSACVGTTANLSSVTPGGTWSSGTPSVATIGSSTGIVTAVSPGTTVIVYTLPTGCSVTAIFTVNPNPGAITGPNNVCVGSTIPLSCPGGGTWTSGNPAIATVGGVSGVVTGVSAGVATITYMLSTGCISTTTITVNPLPAPISGPTSVCIGLNITLSCTTPGGTWSSGNSSIATVGSNSGVVTGVSAGSVTIMYILPTGCSVTFTVIVNPSPCTNGVSETPSVNDVVVYPNPAYDELIIKADLDEYHSYIITNQVGQVMKQSEINSPQTTVNIQSLPAGFYYISIKGVNGTKVMRFVKI